MENNKQNKDSNGETTKPLAHIIDDDEAVLDSLGLLFDSVDIDNQCYRSATEFLDEYQNPTFNKHTGCIVLDIRMPEMSGMDCQKKLNQLDASLPIIFLTGHGDVQLAVEAMKNGALDFIEKPFREQQLLTAIQNAIQYSVYSNKKQNILHQTMEKLDLLTRRESQILEAIVDGKANKVIAIDLNLSERTIEIHRAHVMEKMQANSLAHLIRMYLDVNKN